MARLKTSKNKRNKTATMHKRKPAKRKKRAYIKRNKLYSVQDLRTKGLPVPIKDQLRAGETLESLTDKWYKRLANDGYINIEHYVKGEPDANMSPYLRDADNKKMEHAAPLAQQHFRFARAFLSHYDFKTFIDCVLSEGLDVPTNMQYRPRKGDKHIWAFYCDGMSYRRMQKILKTKYRLKRTLFTICRRLQLMRSAMMVWNKIDKEGLLSGHDDMVVHEVLVYDPEYGQSGNSAS